MARELVTIDTGDGTCPCSVFTPSTGSGPWPAAIFFMDGLGIRPTLFDMGQRLADAGYVVLLPDLFYRAGAYEPLDPRAVFASGDVRAALAPLMGSTDNRRAAADTAAFLDHLAARDDVAGTTVGTTGYCMGGAVSLTVAGTYPDRIAAAASFHGGNMATDDEKSPHLLAPKITAKVLVAGAIEDRSYDAAQNALLDKTLREAGVDAQVSIWEGCRHGWVPADMPVHDAAGAERHWQALFTFFGETLK